MPSPVAAMHEALGDDDRPEILVRPELNAVTDEAVAALIARPDLGIFVRGRALVRVARDGTPPHRWLGRWPGSPVIVPLNLAGCRAVLDLAARWVKPAAKEPKPAVPPSWVAQQVLARLHWPLPYLEAVTETPTIRQDGSIIDRPGLDEVTGILYAPIPGAASWPTVPEQPTDGQVVAAADALLEPLSEFPFVADTDRAAAVAAVLSLIGRHLVAGPVPMFALRAPTPATGKTLLADIIGLVGTGRTLPATSFPYDGEEVRKRVTALAVQGAEVIQLDNVSGQLGSDVLAAALTATDWADRVLGSSAMVRVPLRTIWFATGNNLSFKRTLARRVIPIDLDAGVETPEDRTGFLHADLRAYVREERPRLVVAALTILRAWILAGRPYHNEGPPMGSFEAWDAVIRSAVAWALAADPAGTASGVGRGRVRQQSDEDRDSLAALLGELARCYPDATEWTAADVIHRTNTDDNLRAVVVDVAADRRTGRPTTRALGYVLRASADRPVGGLVLRRLHGYSGVRKCWMVEIQADKADQADPPLGTRGEDGGEDGDRAPGPSASSASSALSASNADDARRLVEIQIGRPLDDEEWQQIATVLAVFPDSEVTVDG